VVSAPTAALIRPVEQQRSCVVPQLEHSRALGGDQVEIRHAASEQSPS
jgi:hypothetical protein